MEPFKFQVDSALLQELGERLVETEHLALVELVKNSYDADATEVKVDIKTENNIREIHVIDNGIGMTLEEVRKFWMIIANTNKISNNISLLYGRPKTGSKGIGRFSCRRLGEILILRTIAINKNGKMELTEITFKWEDFIPGTKVTEIECYGTHTIVDNQNTGTTLIIKKNRFDKFLEYQKQFIERNLALLTIIGEVKRKGFKKDLGFQLFLNFNGEKGNLENIKEKVLNSGWGTLTAKINNQGYAECELDALGVGKLSITSETRFDKLKNIDLKIGIITIKKDHMRNPSILSLGSLNEILPKWGGVHVKFNNFRVFPYGEAGDDWLSIDRDRGRSLAQNTDNPQLIQEINKLKLNDDRYLLALLSSSGYVGEVNIYGLTDKFQMKANREGFVDSEEFRQLKKFVRFTIDWSTVYRHYFIQKRFFEIYTESVIYKKNENYKSGTENLIKDAFVSLQRQIDETVDEEDSKKIKSIIKKYQKFSEEYENKLHTELEHLRLVASSSILLLVFAHEIKSFLGQFGVTIEILKTVSKRIPEQDSKNILKVYEELKQFSNRFYDLLNMVSTISLKEKISTKNKLTVLDRLETAKDCFKLICEEYSINIDLSGVDNGIQIGPMYEAELYSIFLNILSNSIKALIASNNNEKIISIVSTKEKSKTHLSFFDNGLGIDKNNFGIVFERFISDPQDELYNNLEKNINPKDAYILGSGSGIGLSIVKEIVEKYSGKIYFSEALENWKTELHIII